MKYCGHMKLYYVNYQNYQTFMRLTSSDTILVYKFRPERTGFNMYAEYTRQQLTFLVDIHVFVA